MTKTRGVGGGGMPGGASAPVRGGEMRVAVSVPRPRSAQMDDPLARTLLAKHLLRLQPHLLVGHRPLGFLRHVWSRLRPDI